MIKIKRALISVSDKKGIVPFAKKLSGIGVEIISTGGTAAQLKSSGIPVIEISDYTGFPEMLDGRVKTLHPKVHGGLLAVRDNPDHMKQIAQHGIGLIDMVVVNLYPFESVTRKKNTSFDEAIENIDIGGPAMLRSAAKNFRSVAVVCNPDHYEEITGELERNSGILTDAMLFKLAVEVFSHTAHYDTVISEYLGRYHKADDKLSLPQEIALKFVKVQDLRYGENPHQKAAFYRDEGKATALAKLNQLHGKELSFNNLLDLNAAVDFVKDLKQPAAVVIKHNNPTGVAQDEALAKAYKLAWAADPVSAFGGIIGVNREVDQATALLISKSGFMECIIAPAFSKEALTVLQQKKNIRLVTIDFQQITGGNWDYKKVYGGLLLQERDMAQVNPQELNIVTKKKPTASQLQAMLFGWQIIRHVKSNAIVLVKGNHTVGIGCGQTSRVESVKIAIEKSGKDAKGSVMISDAFIPKTDNVVLAAKAGIKGIIQTGGSVEDENVIEAANKTGIAMVMTGIRHFKH
jgi:phosphoribosylaminoimidazolecarboxamide formyltransferase/IMP cyclohydrolase